ncbi:MULTISPECIES: hypothetical protein [Cyanophyceae]|nr:hypothetical protein [Phormidium sp. FACHB-592]
MLVPVARAPKPTSATAALNHLILWLAEAGAVAATYNPPTG